MKLRQRRKRSGSSVWDTIKVMPDQNGSEKDVDASQPPILAYQRNAFSPLVTVRTFYNALDAQLFANELDAAGIRCTLTNQNTNTLGPYAMFSQVELQVRQEDVEEARQLLSQFDASSTDVEPEHDIDPSAPVPDPAGEGDLVCAAMFENPAAMFDAAAAMGAAHVECFLPVLVPRGNRPPGNGKRFVVRVREADIERAREVLASNPREGDEDEPRCPKCGSWRTYALPSAKKGLLGLLFGAEPEESGELECLRCHHRWWPEQSEEEPD